MRKENRIKRFIVEQTGFVQLEACRRFVAEVPDHCSEEQARQLVEDVQESFPDDDGMEWRDEFGRHWVGYDVEIDGTEVYDPDTEWAAPDTEGLKIIKLEGHEGARP